MKDEGKEDTGVSSKIHDLLYRRTRLRILIIFAFDMILCGIILLLPMIPIFDINLEITIISNMLVEKISLFSFGTVVLVFVYVFIRWRYLAFAPKLNSTIKKIGIIGGLMHLICGLYLIFLVISSYGVLPVYLGPIYRNYGYLHLISTVLYFSVFLFFKKCRIDSSKKGDDLND